MTYIEAENVSALETEMLGIHLEQFLARLLPFVQDKIISTQVFDCVRKACNILWSLPSLDNNENNYSSIPEQQHTGKRGRPAYVIKKDQLEFLLDLRFNLHDISQIIGVSVRTIERRMEQFGLTQSARQYSSLSETEVEDIIKQLKLEFPRLGYRQVMGILRSRNIFLKREAVMNAIRKCDPIGTSLRWLTTVKRRTYNVFSPCSLWHMDGNHKLIRYVLYSLKKWKPFKMIR